MDRDDQIATARRCLRDAAVKMAEARMVALMLFDEDTLKAFEAEIDAANRAIGRAQVIIGEAV